jgi:CRP-like cAMP-binding protein
MAKDRIFTEDKLNEYYSNLIKLCLTLAPLSEEEKEEIVTIFKPIRIKRYDHYVKEGQIESRIAYIARGIFRFYNLKNGDEITSDFSFHNSFLTSYISLITRQPSAISVQALENSDILVIDYKTLLKKYDESHNYERIGRLIAEQTFISSSIHLLSFLNDSAEERYSNLIKKDPRLVQHIPLHYIASYLGISAETLSRIRKKLSIS